jgi:SPP1 gp7 family putative phage head morphogenesis protein
MRVPVPKRRVDNRNARRTKANALLLGAKVAEKKYVRQLNALMKAFHGRAMTTMVPHLASVAVKQDGVSKWHRALTGLWTAIEDLRKPTGVAFDAMAKTVAARNFEATKVLLGVTPSQSRVSEFIATVRQANIDLIVNAGRSYAQDVQEIFEDPDSFGLSVDELKDMLLERGSVSESRAELIARDQTLKLNAGLNEVRQTNAGVRRYTWSTSGDERVRPEHAVLDGQECSWDEPPLEGTDGDMLHPGEDFQCRCVALPVVDFGDDEDEG